MRKQPLVCVAVAIALAGCAGESADREVVAGVSIETPEGWHSRVAERRWPLVGGAIVYVANFRLPPGDDEAASKAQRAMGRNDVLVIVAEALPGTDLPVEGPQIDPGYRGASVGRYAVIERFFVASGRPFLLHAVFGTHPPPEALVRGVNAALARLSVARRSAPLRPAPDPAPARALAPAELAPTPIGVRNQCRLAQARTRLPVLCPARLPRPFISWPRDRPLPRVSAQRIPGGLSVGYGAPWEPGSGPDWRMHLWRNRPCCFLHFEVFRRPPGRQHVPAGARPVVLGGRRGLLKDATSWGMSASGDYLYWANHTRFLWREHGAEYVATLHRFGAPAETRALLDRLVRELRPVRPRR